MEKCTILSCLKDKKLSLKAKGLICVMWTIPEGAQISIEKIVGMVKEKERAVISALREMKECGYLKVIKIAPKEGCNFFTYKYVLTTPERSQK